MYCLQMPSLICHWDRRPEVTSHVSPLCISLVEKNSLLFVVPNPTYPLSDISEYQCAPPNVRSIGKTCLKYCHSPVKMWKEDKEWNLDLADTFSVSSLLCSLWLVVQPLCSSMPCQIRLVLVVSCCSSNTQRPAASAAAAVGSRSSHSETSRHISIVRTSFVAPGRLDTAALLCPSRRHDNVAAWLRSLAARKWRSGKIKRRASVQGEVGIRLYCSASGERRWIAVVASCNVIDTGRHPAYNQLMIEAWWCRPCTTIHKLQANVAYATPHLHGAIIFSIQNLRTQNIYLLTHCCWWRADRFGGRSQRWKASAKRFALWWWWKYIGMHFCLAYVTVFALLHVSCFAMFYKNNDSLFSACFTAFIVCMFLSGWRILINKINSNTALSDRYHWGHSHF